MYDDDEVRFYTQISRFAFLTPPLRDLEKWSNVRWSS